MSIAFGNAAIRPRNSGIFPQPKIPKTVIARHKLTTEVSLDLSITASMESMHKSDRKRGREASCKRVKFKAILIVSGCLLWVASCTRIAPLPTADAPPYLKRRGYTPEEIQAIVDRHPLPARLFEKAASERSSDVRMLLAGNKHLTNTQRESFMHDRDEQVRSSLAWNRSLTIGQIRRLYDDPNPYVLAGLAQNPAVPQEILMRLRSERGVGLTDFAMNPKCPPKIRKEILKSDNAFAKELLWRTEQTKPSPVSRRG